MSIKLGLPLENIIVNAVLPIVYVSVLCVIVSCPGLKVRNIGLFRVFLSCWIKSYLGSPCNKALIEYNGCLHEKTLFLDKRVIGIYLSRSFISKTSGTCQYSP